MITPELRGEPRPSDGPSLGPTARFAPRLDAAASAQGPEVTPPSPLLSAPANHAAAPPLARAPTVSTAASAYERLYRGVLWPAWERAARGRTTPKHLAFIEESQWWSPEAMEAHQVSALRALLDHAQRCIPYYREVFRKVGFDPRDVRRRADIAPLPVLTREIVRERYRDLVDPACTATNLKKGTSGSTGTPLKFEYSAESECWRQAIKIRGYSWSGYRPGLPTFYYWASVNKGPEGVQKWKVKIDRALKRETFVDSMHQDEAERRHALEQMRRARPAVIVCYTQSCAQFARWIVDHGLRDWGDIPVLCGAEAVLAADRAAIARAFGPGVFETYGSRETMLMAAECEAHDGMHLMEENILLETARGGEPVPAGESGEVLVTDLNNYGMPFIRYQNGDMATMAPNGPDTACSCGRGLRKLQRVDGRRADTLVDRSGNPVPGIVFHVLFSDARQEVIKQFQARQTRAGDVVLKVVRGQDWSQERLDAIVTRFSSYLGGQPLRVEFHEAIAPAANGKMQTIVVER